MGTPSFFTSQENILLPTFNWGKYSYQSAPQQNAYLVYMYNKSVNTPSSAHVFIDVNSSLAQIMRISQPGSPFEEAFSPQSALNFFDPETESQNMPTGTYSNVVASSPLFSVDSFPSVSPSFGQKSELPQFSSVASDGTFTNFSNNAYI